MSYKFTFYYENYATQVTKTSVIADNLEDATAAALTLRPEQRRVAYDVEELITEETGK